MLTHWNINATKCRLNDHHQLRRVKSIFVFWIVTRGEAAAAKNYWWKADCWTASNSEHLDHRAIVVESIVYVNTKIVAPKSVSIRTRIQLERRSETERRKRKATEHIHSIPIDLNFGVLSTHFNRPKFLPLHKQINKFRVYEHIRHFSVCGFINYANYPRAPELLSLSLHVAKCRFESVLFLVL